MKNILRLENVTYSYNGKKNVLEGINLEFEKGKMYGIVGKSGSGKTTLLSLLSGLTRPTSGEIFYKNKSLRKTDRYSLRSKEIGVVFQSYNLLPHLTAEENVILSMDASGKKFSQHKKNIARNLFKKVNLDPEYKNKKILKLSGGEQQRIAIARALSFEPEIILADEPSGNLDSQTEYEIIDLFKKFAHNDNKCIIVVTHSPKVAKHCDIVYDLEYLKNKQKNPET